ncbi:60S ribosomal protein L27a [Thalictrum thalictroides]|uniref:60S ribosomal protein L27a n=1 Tax=Thalictrum thalictroides TaxID=46969 RepID=A0A7J6WR01_THATH|nr:60S ribosomal protein L27a [Thalictrum thalictroides]
MDCSRRRNPNPNPQGGRRRRGKARSAMTTRFKKNRKMRGHVSAGHGRIGKHRKHPGGRGNAGGMHHHRIFVRQIPSRVFRESENEVFS